MAYSRRYRFIIDSSEGKDLVYEAKVTTFQQIVANFQVPINTILIIEWVPAPNKIAADQKRRRGPKNIFIRVIQQLPSAYIGSRYKCTWVRVSRPQPESCPKANKSLLFPLWDLPRQPEPSPLYIPGISSHQPGQFYNTCSRGKFAEGHGYNFGPDSQEQVIVDDSNSRVRPGILLHNFNGAVRRAIIDQYVFPVLIRLLEYALDTFGQKRFRIIERRYYAYERRCIHIFLLHLTFIPNLNLCF